LPRPDGRLPLRQELQKLEADATSMLVRTTCERPQRASADCSIDDGAATSRVVA
jgi:hypothetical protein